MEIGFVQKFVDIRHHAMYPVNRDSGIALYAIITDTPTHIARFNPFIIYATIYFPPF